MSRSNRREQEFKFLMRKKTTSLLAPFIPLILLYEQEFIDTLDILIQNIQAVEQTNLSLLLRRIRLFVFWENLRAPKSPFKIIWPLGVFFRSKSLHNIQFTWHLFIYWGTSIIDVPRFLVIFDLVLLYNVRFWGLSWTPLPTLISDVINESSLAASQRAHN